ncbi:MAG: hypothetical protein GXO79_08850 [Chlorobi bacterium]|nr:hypothetical protein [Chlorobiota bacterium]
MRRLKKQTIEAILGTIIFHLIVAIIFMLSKLSSIEKVDKEGFLIIFENNQKKQSETDLNSKENILLGADKLRQNIAVNKDQTNNNLSPEENLKRILASMKNFNIEAENNLENDKNKELNAELQKKLKDRSMIDSIKQINEQKKKEDATYFYKGPTNITYTLKNRQHVYLPVPVYKCEGSGIVSLIITVNRKGFVESVSIDSKNAVIDECLIKVAKQYALKTKFNEDSKAPERQKGNITYHFVAQ